jgi:hypothetical protein
MNSAPPYPYEPTDEELVQMRSATTSEAAEVDALIVALCSSSWKKVALIVGQMLDTFDQKYQHLPYCYIQARIDALEDNLVLEVQGDPWAMRHSEVRLASGRSAA